MYPVVGVDELDSDGLHKSAGMVTEGPGFNIFVVKDGRVLTPDRGALHGITRRSILELCAALGVPAEIAPIPRALLEDADEVFAATTAGVLSRREWCERRIQ